MSSAAHPAGDALLQVSGLRVTIDTGRGMLCPVDGLDFSIAAGETFALVGESGCGKSMTALALARLLPDRARIEAGGVWLGGEALLALPEAQMRKVRGGRIGLIFQEPATSLNPVMSIADQIAEALRGPRGRAAEARVLALLEAVGIPDPARRMRDYPFQFSGGMKQRVMIAMALAGEPELLIADEPTTALDVTIQAQVLELLARLQAERAMGMLLITHDLGVVARMAHQVGLMYAGEIVERGPRADFFARPLHPYARMLFVALPAAARRGHPLDAPAGSVPAPDRVFAGCRFVDRCPQALAHCRQQVPAWHRVGAQVVRCHLYAGARPASAAPRAPDMAVPAGAVPADTPVLEVRALSVHFPVRKGLLRREFGRVRAVEGVDLVLRAGRTLALVGESGCGKTTVGKALLQLIPTLSGRILLDGRALDARSGKDLRAMRRAVQMVFQDPFASLNPRMRIGDIIEEGMISLGVEAGAGARGRTVDALLERIGLGAAARLRHPHEFSGGQRQRIGIARALALQPKMIVCDEPTSALDVSVQSQILNLLRELQQERGLACLFITHNLAVVDYLADEVAVMYLGHIVEQGPVERLLTAPAHPYTRLLLAAVPPLPAPDAASTPPAVLPVVAGLELPSPLQPPSGCHFHPRCPQAIERCRHSWPPQVQLSGQHVVRCHLPGAP